MVMILFVAARGGGPAGSATRLPAARVLHVTGRKKKGETGPSISPGDSSAGRSFYIPRLASPRPAQPSPASLAAAPPPTPPRRPRRHGARALLRARLRRPRPRRPSTRRRCRAARLVAPVLARPRRVRRRRRRRWPSAPHGLRRRRLGRRAAADVRRGAGPGQAPRRRRVRPGPRRLPCLAVERLQARLDPSDPQGAPRPAHRHRRHHRHRPLCASLFPAPSLLSAILLLPLSPSLSGVCVCVCVRVCLSVSCMCLSARYLCFSASLP